MMMRADSFVILRRAAIKVSPLLLFKRILFLHALKLELNKGKSYQF